MSGSLPLPREERRHAAALAWLGAIAALLIVAIALPVVLLREQIQLFAAIQYHGADAYKVVPVVPFPSPPVEATETFELDGIRFSVPKDSVASMTVNEELDGRLTIRTKDGLIVSIDRPIAPRTPALGESRTHEFDAQVRAYSASPEDFSWAANAESTRRLRVALESKRSVIDLTTGISRAQFPAWQGCAIWSPSYNALVWLSADESQTGLIQAVRPNGTGGGADALADLVFGSFELVHPPRGAFDEDVRRLAERYPAPASEP